MMDRMVLEASEAEAVTIWMDPRALLQCVAQYVLYIILLRLTPSAPFNFSRSPFITNCFRHNHLHFLFGKDIPESEWLQL